MQYDVLLWKAISVIWISDRNESTYTEFDLRPLWDVVVFKGEGDQEFWNLKKFDFKTRD